MINFLRRIRRNLLSENKGSIYLIYAIGEVVLVVFGILIAFQIDNWNENKELRNTEQQYLFALKEEFNFNKVELETVIYQNKKNTDSALKIVDNTGPEKPQLTEVEFGILATNSLSEEIQFNPSQGVLNAIISSGQLVIFNSQELEFALSSWNGLLNKLRLQEQELLNLRSRTIEMVRNKANLRKVIYGPRLEERGIKQTKFEQGNLHLLKSVAFDGHMVGFVTMSLNLDYHYTKLLEEIDKILLLIDDEIREN